MIAIAGTFTMAPEQRRACLDAVAPVLALVRAEPGCLAYSFGADEVDPAVVSVFELWADADSLEVHWTHPNIKLMRDTLALGGITGRAVEKYRIDAHGSLIGADGRMTTAFGDQAP